MENTGRILKGLTPTARRILFGATADATIDSELKYLTEVDLAHLVMLAERGIVKRTQASALLIAIKELRACDFAPLRGQSAPRGLYLLYENYLMEKLGAETGGILQTARSRNDLNATVLLLRLRKPYHRLLGEALRLQAVLLRRAKQFEGVVMPAYTHYQAAVPITYGHYLAGIASAHARDISGLIEAGSGLNHCPLGAGAVGGTSLPIDQNRTSSMLGFQQPVPNSIDAVASRDIVVRLLASGTILGITLSRLAADLLLWTTSEFGFIALPDHLVGSSSMMPQKRNPFILEHVKGRSGSILGGFVSAATAMHGTAFTNSIDVGTEAAGHIWRSLQSITEAITLARLVVDGARPQSGAMLQRAAEGYTTATELANRLMTDGEMAFRVAHRTVGAIVREAIDRGGESLQEAANRSLNKEKQAVSLKDLNPESVAQASTYGGGPGKDSLRACIESLQSQWSAHRRLKLEQAQKWTAANKALEDAVEHLCA
jgi:argininosuccinate lyase